MKATTIFCVLLAVTLVFTADVDAARRRRRRRKSRKNKVYQQPQPQYYNNNNNGYDPKYDSPNSVYNPNYGSTPAPQDKVYIPQQYSNVGFVYDLPEDLPAGSPAAEFVEECRALGAGSFQAPAYKFEGCFPLMTKPYTVLPVVHCQVSCAQGFEISYNGLKVKPQPLGLQFPCVNYNELSILDYDTAFACTPVP